MNAIGELFEVETLLLEAALAGAPSILQAMTYSAGRRRVKADGSKVTDADLQSESDMLRVLRRSANWILSEESGLLRPDHLPEEAQFNPAVDDHLGADPGDGTAQMDNGLPGATVGAYAYSAEQRRQVAAVGVCPSLGRVVRTFDGVTVAHQLDRTTLRSLNEPPRQCLVSRRTFEDGGCILMEVDHGFKEQYDPLTGETVFISTNSMVMQTRLAFQEELGAKIRGTGSNIQHQMAVADGQRVPGSDQEYDSSAIGVFTSAKGGHWDQLGALVECAGGAVLWLRRVDSKIVVVDDQLRSHMSIMANTVDTAERMHDIVRREYRITSL